MEGNIYEFYQVNVDNPTIFTFNSVGKRNIKKIVSFQEAEQVLGISIDNLILADENEDGTLDAEVDSNNGDILKVLDTVTAILKYYLTTTENRSVYIKGFDDRRISVYQWRIERALKKSTLPFLIVGQKVVNGSFELLDKNEDYVGFLVISQR